MTFGQPRANWRTTPTIGPTTPAPAVDTPIEWTCRDGKIRCLAQDVIDAWQRGGFVPPALHHALIELRTELNRVLPA